MRRRAAAMIFAGVVAVGLLTVHPQPLAAEEACPSAEACLSRSLERNWTQYYAVIEQSWNEKKKLADMLRRARALNRPDVVAQLQAEQAKAEERWRYAESVARALSDPRYKSFLAQQEQKAARAHTAASAAAHKETDLYARLVKSTIGPERQGVIRDIAGYEREAKQLRETFFRDTFLVSLSAAKESAGLVSENLTKIAEQLKLYRFPEATAVGNAASYVFALNSVGVAGVAGVEAAASGMGTQEAYNKNRNWEAALEATRGAAGSVLRAAELLAQSPESARPVMSKAFGATATRVTIYANLLSVGLDTFLAYDAGWRLQDSEQRQVRVETDDAQWRARVDTANRIARDAAAREERAARQLSQQQRIEALYQRIQRESQ